MRNLSRETAKRNGEYYFSLEQEKIAADETDNFVFFKQPKLAAELMDGNMLELHTSSQIFILARIRQILDGHQRTKNYADFLNAFSWQIDLTEVKLHVCVMTSYVSRVSC